jgi:hypothetical protein
MIDAAIPLVISVFASIFACDRRRIAQNIIENKFIR